MDDLNEAMIHYTKIHDVYNKASKTKFKMLNSILVCCRAKNPDQVESRPLYYPSSTSIDTLVNKLKKKTRVLDTLFKTRKKASSLSQNIELIRYMKVKDIKKQFNLTNSKSKILQNMVKDYKKEVSLTGIAPKKKTTKVRPSVLSIDQLNEMLEDYEQRKKLNQYLSKNKFKMYRENPDDIKDVYHNLSEPGRNFISMIFPKHSSAKSFTYPRKSNLNAPKSKTIRNINKTSIKNKLKPSFSVNKKANEYKYYKYASPDPSTSKYSQFLGKTYKSFSNITSRIKQTASRWR